MKKTGCWGWECWERGLSGQWILWVTWMLSRYGSSCASAHGNLERKEEEKVREAEGLGPSHSVRRLSCFMYECLVASYDSHKNLTSYHIHVCDKTIKDQCIGVCLWSQSEMGDSDCQPPLGSLTQHDLCL